ncbi:hypothetical protein WICPIJ_000473 [Wickerhamomyces pijperi]|uniref:Mitochondrial import inner membrane translocase subunit n=1 Tax=Wickerhamomyces pijperi TaxID=599730 RepID=A0A9P8QDH1_WICPI|nr:hypothetical protein WICPIJ_000473 [Wickerhamomyces pijperi]
MSSLNQQLLSQLDDASKQELVQFIESENSKAKVQTSIHQFTDLCFKQCVQNLQDSQLSSAEESCLKGCVNAFLDVNIKVVNGLQSAQQQ